MQGMGIRSHSKLNLRKKSKLMLPHLMRETISIKNFFEINIDIYGNNGLQLSSFLPAKLY